MWLQELLTPTPSSYTKNFLTKSESTRGTSLGLNNFSLPRRLHHDMFPAASRLSHRVEKKCPTHSITKWMVNFCTESEPTAPENSELKHAWMVQSFFRFCVGYQLFNEMERRVVVQVVYGFESDDYGGVDERNIVLTWLVEQKSSMKGSWWWLLWRCSV